MGNNLITTAYFQITRRLNESRPEITVETQTFYTAVWSAPFTLILFPWMDPVDSSIFLARSTAFYTLLAFSGLMGCMLTFSQALCTTVNSPLATAITGNVKDIALTIIGIVCFNDVQLTPLLVFGLLLSLIGAIFYSGSKLQAREEETSEERSRERKKGKKKQKKKNSNRKKRKPRRKNKS